MSGMSVVEWLIVAGICIVTLILVAIIGGICGAPEIRRGEI